MFATIAQLRRYLTQIGLGADADATLTDVLTRATDIVRRAMRAILADETFDYTAWPAASTKIVRGYTTYYLPLPPHQANSVTLVEYMSAGSPITYATVADSWYEEDNRLFRSGGWGSERYRMTAVWGYGPTVPAAIEELTLELAVNLWRSRDKGGFTEIVGVEGGGAIRMVAGLNAQQIMILENVAQRLQQAWV